MVDLQVGTPLWTGRSFGCIVWLSGEVVGIQALSPAGIPWPEVGVASRSQAQWMALDLAQAVLDGHVHPGHGN